MAVGWTCRVPGGIPACRRGLSLAFGPALLQSENMVRLIFGRFCRRLRIAARNLRPRISGKNKPPSDSETVTGVEKPMPLLPILLRSATAVQSSLPPARRPRADDCAKD